MRRRSWIAGAAAMLVLVGVVGYAVTWRRSPAVGSMPSLPSPEHDAAASASPAPEALARAPVPDAAHVESMPAVVADPARAPGASLSVNVRWPDATPAVGIGVFVEATGSSGSLRGTTDSDGAVRFGDVPSGRYAVRGDRGGVLTVLVGDEDQRVELVVPEGRRVLVRVQDELGAGLARAAVFLAASRSTGESALAGRTDEAGELVLEHVEDGRSITARQRGYEPSASIPVANGYLIAGERMDIRLVAGGAELHGQVTDAGGTRALAGARVRCAGGSRAIHGSGSDGVVVLGDRPLPAETITDADGRFSLEDVHSGTLVLTVDAAGYQRFAGVVDLSPRESRSMSIALVPARPLRGRVLDEAGAPIADAVVWAGGLTRDDEVYAISAADGSFELSGLTGERRVIVARASRGRSARTEVDVSTETREWTLVLSGPDREAGQVLDQSGAPVASCHVTFSDAAPAPGAPPRAAPLALTDAEGRFWLAAEDDRDGWLYFWPTTPSAPFPSGVVERRREAFATFVCPHRASDVAVLRVPCAVELERGSRASVALVDVSTGFESLALVDPNGTAEFSHLPPGRYAVEYRASAFDSRRGPVLELRAAEVRVLDPLSPAQYLGLPKAR